MSETFESYSSKAANFLEQFKQVPEICEEALRELAAAKLESELASKKAPEIAKKDETDVKTNDLLQIIKKFHVSVGWPHHPVELKIIYKAVSCRKLKTLFMIRCPACGISTAIGIKKLKCKTAFEYKFQGYKRHVFTQHKQKLY